MSQIGVNLRGRVIRHRYAAGTKSDHVAVMLDTPEGIFKLQRMGGNPFADAELDKLVDQEIEGTGNLHKGTFIMTGWKVNSATSS